MNILLYTCKLTNYIQTENTYKIMFESDFYLNQHDAPHGFHTFPVINSF